MSQSVLSGYQYGLVEYALGVGMARVTYFPSPGYRARTHKEVYPCKNNPKSKCNSFRKVK